MKLLIVVTVCTVALVCTAGAAAGLRCGGALVREGDHLTRVLAVCGEPSFETRWIEERVVRTHPRNSYIDARLQASVSRTVEIRELTFNFGRRRFMRSLQFEGGVLRQLRTLGYGH